MTHHHEVLDSGAGVLQHESDSLETSDQHLSAEQFGRVAELVADGQMPFPSGLHSPQQEELAAAVRERRRRRLLEFVTKQIAQDIQRTTQPKIQE